MQLTYKQKIQATATPDEIIDKIASLLKLQFDNGVINKEQLTKIQNLAASKERLKIVLPLL